MGRLDRDGSSQTEVAVIGAGPYGLALTAHLASKAIPSTTFGRPMSFWQEHMPRGMKLRSSWEASHIADPQHRYTLEAYQRAAGVAIAQPIPLERYVAYGLWFSDQVASRLDPREVTRVERDAQGFIVHLDDGEALRAPRVVVATGIGKAAFVPRQFQGLPPELALHSAQLREPPRFAQRRVVVVGAGQSALESAALLHEAGADVEIVTRRQRIIWLRGAAFKKLLGPLRKPLYPPQDVGPLGLNQIVTRPPLFRLLPHRWQHAIAYRSIRPAGSSWLRGRLADVRITYGREIRRVTVHGNTLRLGLSDGSERTADHLVLATGYQVSLAAYDLLAEELRATIRTRCGYPLLNDCFETSVPGLHMIGAVAAESHGPLFRFVSGAGWAARQVAEAAAHSLR
ncbi:MAG: NAD(P)/FAD-dependent oxidoreductase [Chloroflexi bacterium]|nr:NAD(P)/FAD-dependent oxidoreductase [Chloroflexota bacterium]